MLNGRRATSEQTKEARIRLEQQELMEYKKMLDRNQRRSVDKIVKSQWLESDTLEGTYSKFRN